MVAWTYRSAHHRRDRAGERDRSIVGSFRVYVVTMDVRRITVARTKERKEEEEEEEEGRGGNVLSLLASGGHERALLTSVRLQLNEEEFLFNEHPSRATGSYCPALSPLYSSLLSVFFQPTTGGPAEAGLSRPSSSPGRRAFISLHGNLYAAPMWFPCPPAGPATPDECHLQGTP